MKVLVHLGAPLCTVTAGVIVEADTFAEARERALAQAAQADWEALAPPPLASVQVEGLEEWPQP